MDLPVLMGREFSVLVAHWSFDIGLLFHRCLFLLNFGKLKEISNNGNFELFVWSIYDKNDALFIFIIAQLLIIIYFL